MASYYLTLFYISCDIYLEETIHELLESDSSILLLKQWHIKNTITSVNMGMINHTLNLFVLINTMYISVSHVMLNSWMSIWIKHLTSFFVMFVFRIQALTDLCI